MRKIVTLAAIAVLSSEIADAAWSQRVQPQSRATVPSGADESFSTNSGLAPVPQVTTAPAARLQSPTFDPYSNPSGTTTLPPSMYNTPPMDGAGVPMLPNAPGSFHGSPSFSKPGKGYPSTGFPAAPPVLFPDGVAPWGPDAVAGPAPWGPPLRLFYGPRLQHTYLMGDGHHPREFDWNKTDVSVAMALPNFLWTGQPIFFVPAFGLNLWNGPQFQPGADLPGQSYEAYIDAGWQSDPNRILGADLGVRVGVFTDFNTFTSNSIRILGKGLLRYRMSPTLSVRGGVLYVDRLTTKLLPAGGVLWTPNPQTRIDLYFPEPKASRYLTTLGNFEIWTYAKGEWGGGKWTVKREAGFSDEVELNDIRLIGGIEWARPDMIRQGRRIGFGEVGWVSNRDLRFRATPEADVKFRDTIMFRLGIGY